MPLPGGPPGEAPVWVSRQRGGESWGQEPLLWFPWEGTGEAGQAGLGMASLNNCNGL